MTKFLQNAGTYRHPITFQLQSATTNEYGEKVPTWNDFATTRAGVYPISGKEYVAAVQVQSEATHKVNLRYMPGITSDMQIKFGSRIFRIITIVNFQEMNKELQLVCKEII